MDRLEAITPYLDKLLEHQEQVIIAIDGKCTAGKTTLAAQLAKRYECNVFHMDAFFLRPEQRTPERYAETGGNIDRERFLREVLEPLQYGTAFSYRPFDCRTLALAEPVQVTPRQLNIIEGSYSMHPYFGDPYDLKILLTVSVQLQKERILERPAFLHQRFFGEWIPMENRYLDAFQIAEKADIIL